MRTCASLASLVVWGVGCPAALLGQAGPNAGPTPEVETVEEYYTVTEPDLSAVIARLNGMRLEGEGGPLSQGLTQYWIRPEWRPRPEGGACRVGSLRVRVRIVVTLPRWGGEPRASAEERERWVEIFTAIRDHEYQHRDLTIEASEALSRDLTALRASGCAVLRRAVDGELGLAEERLREAHAALDAAVPRRLVIGG